MLLALDDTDTPHEGCTTHAALRLAAALEGATGPLAAWGLVDAPRLVRLDPAAPHRTRGNGALVLPIGARRTGVPMHRIGRFAGGLLHVGAATGEAADADALDAIAALVSRHLPEPGPGDADPQPGAVLVPGPPDAAFYGRAVSRLVSLADAWAAAPPGTLRLTPVGRRGEIGALAAAAWPRERWTWECMAYRGQGERGPARHLPDRFAAIVETVPGAFDNLDTASGRVRCVPRTPCPVRWGMRGGDPKGLLDAQESLGAGDHWLVQTNHATGDHARHAEPTPAPYGVVRGAFGVMGMPRRGPGGHLFVPSRGEDGDLYTLAAFEPTKHLRDALGAARVGDHLTVLGRSAGDREVVAVEAFCFTSANRRTEKLANPRCPECHAAMNSVGADAGFRCRGCGTRAHAASAPTVTHAGPETGVTHQVPDHVRGHLLPPTGGVGTVLALDGAPGPAIGPLLLHRRHVPALTHP